MKARSPQATAEASQLVKSTPPPLPRPVSGSFFHVLWAVGGKVSILPPYGLNEQASILTDRTDNRRMPVGVREAMCNGDWFRDCGRTCCGVCVCVCYCWRKWILGWVYTPNYRHLACYYLALDYSEHCDLFTVAAGRRGEWPLHSMSSSRSIEVTAWLFGGLSWMINRPPWRAWFEASFPPPYYILISLSSVYWPSWRIESHRRSFPRFSLGKSFCLDHSCFNSYFDLFVLGSTLRLYFCSGQEREASSSGVCFKWDLRKRRVMSGSFEYMFSFGLCISELKFWFSMDISPDVCLVFPRIQV